MADLKDTAARVAQTAWRFGAASPNPTILDEMREQSALLREILDSNVLIVQLLAQQNEWQGILHDALSPSANEESPAVPDWFHDRDGRLMVRGEEGEARLPTDDEMKRLPPAAHKRRGR